MQEVSEITIWLQQGVTITASGGALVALALYLRKVIKGLGLESAQMHVAESAASASDTVLQNLQTEIERLSKRVAALENQINHLNEKLANVRLVALECYEIALSCECDPATRELLLGRLRQIIKDA